MVLSFSKSDNSSNGSLDQTWRVYKSKALFCISRSIFSIHSLHKQFFHIDFWVSLNFFFFFLCQKLSKAFWFSKTWKLVLFILSFYSPFAKKNSPRTNRLNSFCVSLAGIAKGGDRYLLFFLSLDKEPFPFFTLAFPSWSVSFLLPLLVFPIPKDFFFFFNCANVPLSPSSLLFQPESRGKEKRA